MNIQPTLPSMQELYLHYLVSNTVTKFSFGHKSTSFLIKKAILF